mgnify:CR=1 FL=1
MPLEAPTKNDRPGIKVNNRVVNDIENFNSPPVKLTQTVLWFPDRTANIDQARSAIVTEVGDRAISVAILYPGVLEVYPHTGVRHRSDPDKAVIDEMGNGVWDYVDDGRDSLNPAASPVAHLMDELVSLKSRVTELEAALTAPSK